MEQFWQFLPEGVCVLLCFFGCLCNWVRTGSIKKAIESLCPSVEPVQSLQLQVQGILAQVESLQKQVDSLLSVLKEAHDN